jgi:hypothetical protein
LPNKHEALSSKPRTQYCLKKKKKEKKMRATLFVQAINNTEWIKS